MQLALFDSAPVARWLPALRRRRFLGIAYETEQIIRALRDTSGSYEPLAELHACTVALYFGPTGSIERMEWYRVKRKAGHPWGPGFSLKTWYLA